MVTYLQTANVSDLKILLKKINFGVGVLFFVLKMSYHPYIRCDFFY